MSLSTPLITDSTIQAATWLKKGQLLAYPTESVWGIGCDPFNKQAVMRLLDIKQRPIEKGMIVVTDSPSRITALLEGLSIDQRQRVLDSWQADSINAAAKQAHTWLLPIPKNLPITIPSWITGAHDSVAVRVIDHPLVKRLCAQMVSVSNPYGFVVSTSCNPSGKPPALSLIEAQSYFLGDNVNSNECVGYLKGETLGYQLPSQISDALTGQVIR
ncbi:Threonylcarbamoyl-AMP synthase [Psychrobacter sp. SC65A.3]|uniref:L-threonylcarbamoyladenylate synthase n=1 Tax=Psychrobacter sp. SC65A.3 TaxID=2983299 RepID=UPI0021DAE469|nr:Sua5/YciO/YrdC/YwlC family protein [Psychrobacter sp. SC65A.3]WAI89084.1 Threonylcarbamoyl-AMP synthase [Psychrobacter sp. SC65A.3]